MEAAEDGGTVLYAELLSRMELWWALSGQEQDGDCDSHCRLWRIARTSCRCWGADFATMQAVAKLGGACCAARTPLDSTTGSHLQCL